MMPLKLVVVDTPFSQWGLDLIGEINPHSLAEHVCIITTIDYFIKWMEVMPLKKFSSESII